MALHPAKNIHSALGILKNDCPKEMLQRDIQGDFAVNHSTASEQIWCNTSVYNCFYIYMPSHDVKEKTDSR